MANIPNLTWTWKIRNLSGAAGFELASPIKSDRFAVELGGIRWMLYVILSWENASSPVHVFFRRGYLSRPPIINAIFELSFLTAEGAPHLIGKHSLSVEEGLYKFETHNWPTHEDVFVTKRSTFLPDGALTVRCRIWNSNGGVERPIYSSSVSQTIIKKLRTFLAFQNFSKLEIGNKETAVYPSNRDSAYLLKLELCLSGTNKREAVIDVTIEFRNANLNHFIRMHLSVVDRFGRSVMTRCSDLQLPHRQPIYRCEFDNFIQRKDLMYKMDDYLPNDSLTLHFQQSASFLSHCETEVSLYHPATQIDADDYTYFNTPLLDDLLSLYKDGALTDFTLRADNKSFPVHKTVLGARSPVFRALFSSGMKEASSSIQYIPDLDADTVNRMLHFLYTDTIRDLQWENLINHQILSLKRKCFSCLRDSVNASNVREILELAERHSDEGLKSAVDEFLLHHDDEIVA